MNIWCPEKRHACGNGPAISLLALIISFLLFYGPGTAGATGLARSGPVRAGLAAKIQAAYGRIRDASGSFVQQSCLKDLGKTETFGGHFMIKLPGKMRYIYNKGSRDQVIIRGNVITIYQKNEAQVLKSWFNPGTYGTAPVAFLGGLGNIGRDFFVSEKNGKLVLTPKNKNRMSGVTSITVTPSNGAFPIRSFSIRDRYENTVRITLKDVKLNRGIKNSVFEFTPPHGTHVFDYTQPQTGD